MTSIRLNKEDAGLAPDQLGEINEEPKASCKVAVYVTWSETAIMQGSVVLDVPSHKPRHQVIEDAKRMMDDLIARIDDAEVLEIEDVTFLSVE